MMNEYTPELQAKRQRIYLLIIWSFHKKRVDRLECSARRVHVMFGGYDPGKSLSDELLVDLVFCMRSSKVPCCMISMVS